MKKVAIYACHNCQMLDVTGPFQVFATANTLAAEAIYQPLLVSDTIGAVMTNSGMSLVADYDRDSLPALDTLLVAGGFGAKQRDDDQVLLDWLNRQAAQVRRIGSVCTGAFLLAAAGLLDGRRAVTHWRMCDELTSRYPEIDVIADAIYIADDGVYTSAGVTAGIDLALSLVRADCGQELATEVARELVMFMHRPGGQAQFQSQPALPDLSAGPLRQAIELLRTDLERVGNVEMLADAVSVTVRHLSRLFRQELSMTPADYIGQVRLHRAQQLLEKGARSLDQVAEACGLSNADQLRRLFCRRLGITPTEYQQRFAGLESLRKEVKNGEQRC